MKFPNVGVLSVLCSAGLCLSVVATSVFAAGFYVPPKGPAGVGLAHVGGAARANDGSTVYFNPAGMVLLEGDLVQGGIDFISPDIDINNAGSTATAPGTGNAPLPYPGGNASAGELTPVPSFYYAKRLPKGDLWFGLAVTAPFGLGLDYGDDWFGRYDSIESELATVDIAPTFAYRLSETWSIGGGINIQYADASLSNAVPNTLNPGGPTVATDGFAEVTGDDWTAGFNIGVMYRFESTRVGVHYRSGINHTLDGDTTIEGLTGPLVGGNGEFGTTVDLELPAIATVAVAHDLTPALTLLFELQWFGWDSFDEIRIEFDNDSPDNVRPQDFRDSYSAGIGIEYHSSPQWTIRTGILLDESPTVDRFRNTSIPDSNQIWFGIGASYARSDQLLIDLGYARSDFEAADIDLTQTVFADTPAAGTLNTRGRTDNVVDVFSAGLWYRF